MQYLIQDKKTGQYVGDRRPLVLTTTKPLTWKTPLLANQACESLNRTCGEFKVVKKPGDLLIPVAVGWAFGLSAIAGAAFVFLQPSAVNPTAGLKTTQSSELKAIPDPQLELATFHVGEAGEAVPASQPNKATIDPPDSGLKMIMVDNALLTDDQQSQLSQLATQLPPTAVGKQCKYYGKPTVWCLILPTAAAQDAFSKLTAFGAVIKPVKRIGKGITKENPG